MNGKRDIVLTEEQYNRKTKCDSSRKRSLKERKTIRRKCRRKTERRGRSYKWKGTGASAAASGSSTVNSRSRVKVVETMKKISSRNTTSISGVRFTSTGSTGWRGNFTICCPLPLRFHGRHG